jgi:uncharacterized membrane protein required for colicin V production
MNALDIGILIVLSALALYGVVKGIVRLVLGFAALLVGIFLGCWFNAPVAALLEGWLGNETARRLAALALVFFVTLAIFAVLIWFITKSLEAVKLRWVDRLAGALLGAVVAALLVAAAMVPLTALLPEESTLVAESTFSPYVLQVSSLIKRLVPEDLKARFERARQRIKASGEGLLPEGREALEGLRKTDSGKASSAEDPDEPDR